MTPSYPRWTCGVWICAALGCAAPGTKSAAVPIRPVPAALVSARASAEGPGATAEPPETPISPTVAEGASLFKTKGCVMCHGEDGKGGVRNRYSQGEFVPALEKVASGYSEDELKEKIRKGVPQVAKADPNGPVPILIMPGWEDKLAPEELDRIVAYLFSLGPKGGDADGF